jgi:hypothetical protein
MYDDLSLPHYEKNFDESSQILNGHEKHGIWVC